MKPEEPAKTAMKKQKNMMLNQEIVRAAGAAVEAGVALDFGDAVEKGLRLLLRSEGFPESLTELELRDRLSVKKPTKKPANLSELIAARDAKKAG